MPHRDPLATIAARCERLREELGVRAPAPRPMRTVREALAEQARLERALAQAEARDEEEEEPAAVIVRDAPADIEPPSAPADARAQRWTVYSGAAIAVLGVVFLLVLELTRAEPPSSAAPPVTATRWRTACVVVGREGNIPAQRGDRCDIWLTASAPPIGPADCRVRITCPGVERRFVTDACTMKDGAAHVDMGDELQLEERAGRASFRDERHRGRAELRFSDWR